MSFHFPYFYNSYFPNNYTNLSNPYNKQNLNISTPEKVISQNSNNLTKEKFSPHHQTLCNSKIENMSNSSKEDKDCFFEIFGLKLQFDDVLLIVLLFFLYSEGIKDDELFIILILLLLS